MFVGCSVGTGSRLYVYATSASPVLIDGAS